MVKQIKKTKNVNETKQEDGIILLKGKKALLLAEACKLTKSKKAAEKRIKEIKKEISLSKAGEYINDANDKLVISESDKFSEIDPKKLYNKFKAKKKLGKYFTVVKVQIGALEKIIAKTVITKMREKLDPIKKWSFK